MFLPSPTAKRERKNTVKKWEYTQEVIHLDKDVVETANEYGQNGWELVSVLSAFHSLNRSLIFKREISEPATTPEELVEKTASHIHHSETRW